MKTVVRPATPSDLQRAGEVLGDAFHDYPWTRWTVDPHAHRTRVTQLQTAALELIGLPFGHVWVTCADDVIQTVAVWMDSTVNVPEIVTDALLRSRQQLEGARHQAALDADRELAGWQPAQRHYLLAAIGTTPEMQGRGLAGLALQPVLEEADRLGSVAFLETSSEANVGFYVHRGFHVADHRTISHGGPDVWAMIRNPRGHHG